MKTGHEGAQSYGPHCGPPRHGRVLDDSIV